MSYKEDKEQWEKNNIKIGIIAQQETHKKMTLIEALEQLNKKQVQENNQDVR